MSLRNKNWPKKRPVIIIADFPEDDWADPDYDMPSVPEDIVDYLAINYGDPVAAADDAEHDFRRYNGW